MANWFANGDPVESIAVDDRGLQYGDGVFETIAIRNGEPRLWQNHMERLAGGCKALGIETLSEQELADGVTHALADSKTSDTYAVVKIIVTAGKGIRGYGRAIANAPSVLFGAFVAAPQPIKLYEKGAEVILCETRLASDSALAGVKTLNRLEQVLARSEINGSDLFEGLTMDADDNIICGTMSNVFFVHNKSISTAAVNRCGVAGVMRRHVIESLQGQGIDTQIRYTTQAEIEDVDEVFLSNSQFGVIPVRRCGTCEWPVGEMTRSVMTLLTDTGISEFSQ